MIISLTQTSEGLYYPPPPPPYRLAWGGVNRGLIFIFGWTIPLNPATQVCDVGFRKHRIDELCCEWQNLWPQLSNDSYWLFTIVELSRMNSVCFIKSLFYCLSALKQCRVKLYTVGKKEVKMMTNDAFETGFVNQSGLNRIYFTTQHSKNLLSCSMGEKC